MNEIMDLSLAQFLLLSVEASEIESQTKAASTMTGYNAPMEQDFRNRM